MSNEGSALWTPTADRQHASQMRGFLDMCRQRYLGPGADYARMYQWSIRNGDQFWSAVAEFGAVRWQTPPAATFVPPPSGKMLGAVWFPGAKLNFAENLLPPEDDEVVILSHAEGRGRVLQMTGRELRAAVTACAASLRKSGIGPGDRVAAVVANVPEAIIAMLATTAIGAIWSSCSPDFGVSGIVDRFSQIAPKCLFLTKSYFYQGKHFELADRIQELRERLPSVCKWVLIDHLQQPEVEYDKDVGDWRAFLQEGAGQKSQLMFYPGNFDHPIYILYSSGTTGAPKCIVHSAGGTLLQHKKELMLHSDLRPRDRLLYYTTCGWMMWNWMVSALACRATVVLYEGSVGMPDLGALWRFAAEQSVQVLGISPKFIQSCMNAQTAIPPMPALRTILSTGSPLLPEHSRWIYAAFDQQVHLASISGGTDIVSCFMLGNPLLPVYAGEIQGPGLGMAVEVWDSDGTPLDEGRGELVCTQPFPSMPIGFWGDTDGSKYRAAYFEHFSNREVWRHGDYVEFTAHGGMIVHGRSDATLNPGGVRIGSAEIYRHVESLAEVDDSLVVGLPWHGDVAVILFVKLAAGVEWSAEIASKIRSYIRQQLTPRHVPAQIFAVGDIPYTRSGKKVEIAAGEVLQGKTPKNLGALANPKALHAIAQWASAVAAALKQ